MQMNITDNAIASTIDKMTKGGLLDKKKVKRDTVGIMQKIIMNAREKTPLPPLPSSPSSDPQPQPEVSAPEAFPQEEENNTPEEDTPEEQKRQEKARQILENI